MVQLNVTFNVTLASSSPSTREDVDTGEMQSRPQGEMRTLGARVWKIRLAPAQPTFVGLDGGQAGLNARHDHLDRRRHRGNPSEDRDE
jgi:hypothetical protein